MLNFEVMSIFTVNQLSVLGRMILKVVFWEPLTIGVPSAMAKGINCLSVNLITNTALRKKKKKNLFKSLSKFSCSILGDISSDKNHLLILWENKEIVQLSLKTHHFLFNLKWIARKKKNVIISKSLFLTYDNKQVTWNWQ